MFLNVVSRCFGIMKLYKVSSSCNCWRSS